MVLHATFNQGIQLCIGPHTVTIQATVERGQMRYWVGKPDVVVVEVVQCRTSTKAPIGPKQPRVSP